MKTGTDLRSGHAGLCAAIALLGLGLCRTACAAGAFVAAGSMNESRSGHTATLLPNGKVLVTGGQGIIPTTIHCTDPDGNPFDAETFARGTAELFDPTTGQWTPAAPLGPVRQFHTATLLANGKVLVAGGTDNNCWLTASTETARLYDPASGTWMGTGPMASHAAHTATLLPNGKVLVAGGYDRATLTPWARADIYDPDTNTWSQTGSMHLQRVGAAAALLPNGIVLVAGGNDGFTGIVNDAEFYDPRTGLWAYAISMNMPASGDATVLLDGRVLTTGHINRTLPQPPELYDPATGGWTGLTACPRLDLFSASSLLLDGRVLVAGGYPDDSRAYLYDAATGTCPLTSSMTRGRLQHTATRLLDGRVLIAGGGAFGAPSDSAELYIPAASTSTTTTSTSSSTSTSSTTSTTTTSTSSSTSTTTTSSTTSTSHTTSTSSSTSTTSTSTTSTTSTTRPRPTNNPSSSCIKALDLGDGTILDMCAGLQWEDKTSTVGSGKDAADLNDVNNLYTWAGCCNGDCMRIGNLCQPDAAAAATCAAQADGGTDGCATCAAGICEVDPERSGAITTVWDWLNQLNAAGFAGFNDWRLPSEGARNAPPTGTNEFETILPPTCPGTPPCIYPQFAPTSVDSHYVSASSVAGAPDRAWAITFDGSGVTDSSRKIQAGGVRAVRAPCENDTVPAKVTAKLSAAASLAERALTTGPKQEKKLLKRARTLLNQAKAKASRAAKGKKPKLSPACAAALKKAADRLAPRRQQ